MFLVHSHICILVMNVGIMLIEYLQVYVKQKCENCHKVKTNRVHYTHINVARLSTGKSTK